MNTILILTTTPTLKLAKLISRRLVKDKLAACCTISGPVTSIFSWEKKMQSAGERMIFIKTKKNLYAQVESAIKELHRYSVPEIIALNLSAGSKEYIEWISNSVSSIKK